MFACGDPCEDGHRTTANARMKECVIGLFGLKYVETIEFGDNIWGLSRCTDPIYIYLVYLTANDV